MAIHGNLAIPTACLIDVDQQQRTSPTALDLIYRKAVHVWLRCKDAAI